ncbi:hypothetical protein [Marinobacter bohaiensis]|uniref:hypothetical protein n=1 Tax=Marinobacter bohaiensis TaxID=2201898 RepID=UPI000DAC1DA9|nr:hypothetical protein [Marinobacter bohaiensis]
MLKTALHDTWVFFKRHYVALALIILPIVIPIDLFHALYNSMLASDTFVLSEQALPLIVAFAAYPVYAVAVVFYIHGVIHGEPKDTRTLWQLGLKYWVPFAVLSAILGAAVVAGLILMVIPAIIVAIKYAFAEFDLLLDGDKPLDALKNSWGQTAGYFWILLGGFALISLAIYTPYYIIGSLVIGHEPLYTLVSTVLSMAFSVLSSLYTIFAFRIYDFARQAQAPATTLEDDI